MLAIALTLLAADGHAMQAPPAIALQPEKKVCRTLDVTGTIMSTRVCQTRTQWAAFDAEHQRAMDNRRTDNTIDRAQGGAGQGRDSFGQ